MAIISTPQSPDFASTFIQTLAQEKQLQMQKEQLKIQQQDQKLRESKFSFDVQQGKIEEAIRNAQLQGAMKAAEFLVQQNPEFASAVSGLSPAAMPSFLANAQQFQMGEGQIKGQGLTNEGRNLSNTLTRSTLTSQIQTAEAGAQRAASDARVAQATEGPRIQQASANLLDTNLRNKIQAEIANGSDPANGARAISAWIGSEGQLTFGEASEAVGFTAPTSIDPGLRYRSPQGAGSDAVKAQGFYPLMQEAHNNIGNLHEQGVRLSLPGALQKGTRLGSIDALLNYANNPEQRQLIQAQRAFADYYRFSLSGQQSSDAERLAMLLSITEQFGDDDATIAQKRRLRQTMLNVTRQRAMGTMSALEGAQISLDVAKELGDDSITSAYQNLLNDINEDVSQGVSISTIPGDNTFQDVPNIIDSVIR